MYVAVSTKCPSRHEEDRTTIFPCCSGVIRSYAIWRSINRMINIICRQNPAGAGPKSAILSSPTVISEFLNIDKY